MAKQPKKSQGNPNTSQNSPNLTPKLDSKLSKSRKQIYAENYQKNKEKKKQQRRARYQQQKELAEKKEREQLSKYYGAEAFRILMSFKQYTELNKEKKQLWQDFNWTLQDCQENIKEGLGDVAAIMKLEHIAGKSVRDYWETAKREKQQKVKSWNVLNSEEQDRLIKYWGYEKTRMENNYLTEEERLKKQSKEYLKEIELAKFHEERGKIKCSCYSCENKKILQGEIKQKWKKELEDYDRKSEISDKEKCPGCGKLKVLDEEVGVCKKCKEIYE